jgi:3-phosphoshikimate 1-carboxyvinyltransferase
VATVREGLERMGIDVSEETSRLLITGGKPKGAIIDSHDDHRIAMAFSILGALAGNTVIDKAESVSKTFPEFWHTLERAGVRMKIDGS